MTEQRYFQWQNEFLLKTIYPMREVKLRDFLIDTAEIDLWAAYKNLDITRLQDEIKAFTVARGAGLAAAYQAYITSCAYFLKPDVREDYMALLGRVDDEELAKINQMHANFVVYFPKLVDVRKEKYFVSEREKAWVEHRNQYRDLIKLKKRRVESILPEHPKHAIEQQALEQMENVALPMLMNERERLRDFLNTFEKIEQRKLAFFESRQKTAARQSEITRKLSELQASIHPLEARKNVLQAELTLAKTPPDRASLENYFNLPDVLNPILGVFPLAGQVLIGSLNDFHKKLTGELNYTKEERSKLSTLRNHLYNWQMHLKDLQKEVIQIETNLRNMPATWAKRAESEARLTQLRETDLKVFTAEIEKLNGLLSAVESAVKPREELEKGIQLKGQELEKLHQNLSIFNEQAQTLQAEFQSNQAILNQAEADYLLQYTPEHPVNLKDIVLWRVEERKAELAQKKHFELLEEIVKRFMQTPQRFPLWLQYMVIHFSGMRYASAHGSWADPRNFLVRWQAYQIEKTFEKLDDANIEQRCHDKIAQYAPANSGEKPKLAYAETADWQTKRDNHLKAFGYGGPKTRRSELIALLSDEKAYELQSASQPEVDEMLLALKESLPGWMWKEVVRLTPLRVNHVSDADWEKLTPQEETERGSYQNSELRVFSAKWKEDYTTLWREEHGRAHQLIVARAVCNETAEHCQHIRGHLPPGGLTPKAPWYIKNETEGKLPGSPRPYFKKAKTAEDYSVGASILWLRFGQNEPNPWQSAAPFVTKDGDTLLPAEFFARKGGTTGVWNYTQGDPISRTRTWLDANKQQMSQTQYLRWIHEATVAEIGETAEGQVILTFETALPDDDPALSSIGVFKHYAYNLLYNKDEENYNASFVGFVPESTAPTYALEDMLDWNKILLREVLPPAEMEFYRKQNIRKQV